MYTDRNDLTTVNSTTSDLFVFYRQNIEGEAIIERTAVALTIFKKALLFSSAFIEFKKHKASFMPPTVHDIKARDHK